MLREGHVLQAVDAIFVSDKDEVLLELLQTFPKRSPVFMGDSCFVVLVRDAENQEGRHIVHVVKLSSFVLIIAAGRRFTGYTV